MDDNKFFITIWKLIAGVLCTIVLTLGGCTVHQQQLISEAIKAGADPVLARCGIVGGDEARNCFILNSKRVMP